MDYIKSFYRIAKYEDENGKKIDILIVKLKKEKSLERARSMQRNFIAWYLKGSRGYYKDAALVAFVSPDSDDWRFSFVKIDYIIENGKINEEKSPAKRFSYLVGKNENSHTAKSRFVDLLMEDKKDPNISDIEEAFSVEKVTKEFYLQYRQLFIKLTNSLNKIIENNEKVREEFNKKNIRSVDFTKKLLGQIIFLYFLQKKGWFGVERDANWGTGPKNFLRQIFDKKYSDYDNFFNDILEPLFYNTLSIDRHSNDDYSNKFNCKIPFLNGGLFDPINEYDWLHTDMLLPNDLFSNTVKTKDDTGTGILDVFDRFNFTVKEDEPLEKEVAVDPEMLGKIFEKLCGVNDKNFNEWVEAIKSKKKSVEKKFNKKYGIYYTPREIVHYMCQESLIQYLISEMDDKINKENIEYFIKHCEESFEREKIIEKEHPKTYKQEGKLKPIKEHKIEIDNKLKTIKVCDPAVGSGAFPVEMISLIAKARNFLSNYISDNNRSIYKFKREAIENSMYGVDIDVGAVEIAKLRFWLSLIVDEEDYKNIKPLPNLSYKIMQGNSLIEEFHGISLELEKRKDEDVLFSKDDKLDFLIQELHKKQNKFFNATQHNEKEIAQKDVEDAIIEIFHYELEKQKKDYFNELRKIEDIAKSLRGELREQYIKREKIKLSKRFNDFDFEKIENELREMTHGKKIRKFFPWKLYFADVFRENGGFDIVIGNPPYIDYRKIDLITKKGIRNFESYKLKKTASIYIYFIEFGLSILRKKGNLVFINPYQYLTSDSGYGIRKFVIDNYKISKIIDVSNIRVFSESSTYTCINFLLKEFIDDNNIEIVRCRELSEIDRDGFFINQEMAKRDNYRIIISEVNKVLERISKISGSLGDFCNIFCGTSAVGFGKKIIKNKEYLKMDSSEKKNYHLIIQSSNTGKYFFKNLNKYITDKIYNIIVQESFSKEKIFFARMTKFIRCMYTKKPYFGGKINVLINFNLDPLYLLALLNSSLLSYWYYNKFESKHLSGGYLGFDIPTVKEIPIPKISKEKQQPFIKIVDQILSLKKAGKDTTELENQIDVMVYKLYELTYDEVKTVDPDFWMSEKEYENFNIEQIESKSDKKGYP